MIGILSNGFYCVLMCNFYNQVSMLQKRYKDIKSEQYPHLKKSFYLGKAFENKIIYKYMDLETALICLKNGNLRFSQISKWKDEYEKRFYQADYSALNVSSKCTPKLYACCFTTQNTSEAAWKTYTYQKTGLGHICVKFTLNIDALRKALDQYACDNDCLIYDSSMYYRYTDEIIDNLHKKESIYYSRFFKNFTLESYLTLLSLKRPAFAYEKEVRFFVIPNNQKNFKDFEDIIIPWKELVNCISIGEGCSATEKELLYEYWRMYVDSENIVEVKEEQLYACSDNRVTIEGENPTDREKVITALRKGQFTIDELCGKLKINTDVLKRVLSDLKKEGFVSCEIFENKNVWFILNK